MMLKKLLATTALVAFATTSTFTIAQAAEVEGPEVKWNVSLWGKERAFTAGFEKLKEVVEAKTDGKFQMELHYGAALSKSRENLDGISVGAFEAAMTCNFYHPQKNPALMVLTMPFLPMASWDDNRKIRDAVYNHPAVQKEHEQWNAMLYMSSYLPQYEFLGKGEPPMKLDDWKGKTVRAGGGLGSAMKGAGRNADLVNRDRGVHRRATGHHGRSLVPVHLQPCGLQDPRSDGLVHLQPVTRHLRLPADLFQVGL
jgi:TRAP-type C4-dicarboxylate transport system substrate-binding protein